MPEKVINLLFLIDQNRLILGTLLPTEERRFTWILIYNHGDMDPYTLNPNWSGLVVHRNLACLLCVIDATWVTILTTDELVVSVVVLLGANKIKWSILHPSLGYDFPFISALSPWPTFYF